jgi:transposase
MTKISWGWAAWTLHQERDKGVNMARRSANKSADGAPIAKTAKPPKGNGNGANLGFEAGDSVDLSEVSLGRCLRKLGFSHISDDRGTPSRIPNPLRSLEKSFPARVVETESHQDEMRVGQKNSLVYQWTKKGTRPRQPKDQRYENAYLFGAVCPSRDTGVAIITPYANTAAMRKHLEEISHAVAPGAHAMIILDQAGWHTTRKLKVPKNLTMVSLPPACPELNAAENIWQYLRQTYLSNRVFKTYTDILDACQEAWQKLLDETGRIASIATRDWAIIDQTI